MPNSSCRGKNPGVSRPETRFKVGVVGAGRMGSTADEPHDVQILSHAHGYTLYSDFELVGFADIEIAKAEAAAKRWGGSAFNSVEELFEVEHLDIVSICLPDEQHYASLLDLAKRQLKLVFLEKPAVRTDAEADIVRALYSELPVRVQVNYTRRFVPEIRAIRECIRSGTYGRFVTGTGYYGKGLLHNGSHLVDLLQFLLGTIGDVEKRGEVDDFYKDDPSVSALLTMPGGGMFHLCCVDCRLFHVFELDLTFEQKRIRISDLGTTIEEFSLGDHREFDGYRTLNRDRCYETQHTKAMRYAIENIRENLLHGEPLLCSLQSSLEVVTTCSRIAGSRK